tara:strand:- start:1728 stop:2996 length:1269 start_codon:yes stop_codon:yes gene_type:complete
MKKIIIIVGVLLTIYACKSTGALKDSNSKEIKNEAFGVKPELIRQPYLQMVIEDSVIITWKTNEISSNCYVEFVENETNKASVIKGYLTPHEGFMFNEVSISGLNPETTYNYSIYSNGHLLATGEDYHFTTASDDKNTAFTFYALGDIGAPNNWGFAKEPAARISELKNKPDFGLGLGDIVYPKGESKNYDNHLFKPFQQVFKNIPFYPVPGNHDWLSDPENNFVKEWALPNNEHYYSFTYSNTLFIGLDSSDGGFFNKEEQILWLENTLKDNEGEYDWTIVFLHHNGKTCSYKPNYKYIIDFYKIFAENKVDLVLNGHAHTYERLKPYDENGNVDVSRKNETSYKDLKNRFVSITIGAGGKLNKKWNADPNNPKNCDDGSIVAHFEHVPSFGLVSIDGSTLSLKGINSYTGQTFDTFEINK